MHTQYRKQIEEFLSKIEANGWVHHGFLENIIAGKDRRGNSNSIYIIQLEKLRLPSREKSQQVTLARRMGTRKAIGIHEGKTRRLFLSLFGERRGLKFQRVRSTSYSQLGQRELPKRQMTFSSPPCSESSLMTENYVISPPIFFVIHRKSIENEQVRSAHFEDILYTRVCGST